MEPSNKDGGRTVANDGRTRFQTLGQLLDVFLDVALLAPFALGVCIIGLALGMERGWLLGAAYFVSLGLVVYGCNRGWRKLRAKLLETHVPQRRID